MANYRVRLLSHLGRYPAPPLALGGDMIFAQHGLLFSCSQNRMVSNYRMTVANVPFSEVQNWSLQEVRLFSAIYLGHGGDLGAPYPLPFEQDIFAPTRERIAADPVLTERLVRTLSDDDYCMRGNRGLVPHAVELYKFDAWTHEQTERANNIWQRFDLSNPVIVRGMACLLKSGMLATHVQFLDASLMAVHVAMDAAHSIVLTNLRNAGVNNPSSLDAGRWVDEALGYDRSNEHFLADWYYDRIRNIHPDNKFGAEGVPFFCVDDIYDLTNVLKEIFYCIITGKTYDRL